MNSQFGLDNPRFLRGGWFVGPEEFEQMGYTIGLPPGYFAPDIPEVHVFSEELKSRGGIIFPSTIKNSNENKPKKKIVITNLPEEMTSDQLSDLLEQALLKHKLTYNENLIEFIERHGPTAFVTFKSSKDAEAAVSLKIIIHDNKQHRIYWFQNKYATDMQQYAGILSDTRKKDSLIIETTSDHFPSEERIAE